MADRSFDALTLGLEELPLSPDGVAAGEPTAGIASVYEFAGVEVGVWELTAGTVTDTEVDEVAVVVAGRGTVTFADGEVLELRPGVVFRLRAGEHTTWHITEPLRKVWVAP